MKLKCNFDIYKDCSDYILIKDNANEKGTMSITNDAENVIEFLSRIGSLNNNKILYYIDTDGRVDILTHKDGKFIGFQFGYDSIKDFAEEKHWKNFSKLVY